MKAIILLADGMGDEPLAELNDKTPLEYLDTPAMDFIAANGANGTFLTLPDGLPTSSDVANMSVMGFEPELNYPGRGPIEAVSQGIDLKADDVAWRCNLVYVNSDNIMSDFSAGHIPEEDAAIVLNDLQKEFGSEKISFYSGVSYRNLLVLHGNEFSADIDYSKPDSSHGINIDQLRLCAIDSNDKKAVYTVEFLTELEERCAEFLAAHPLNAGKKSPANRIWPWSPGYKPNLKDFSDIYKGKTGAVISAVDVIQGIGLCTGMEVIKVPGATGFIDTNYAGKVAAALDALEKHDFVYLHVEAIDECSHLGDLELKKQAITDFDQKIAAPILNVVKERDDVNVALLPDHGVPIKLRKHTTDPVPLAVYGKNIEADKIKCYSEHEAPKGSLGLLKKQQLVRMLLDL